MPASDPTLLSAEDLLALYARRGLSPVEVLDAVGERITRLNPGFNAFAAMNPEAPAAARAAEARWQAGRPLGPLDGVPVTVEDTLDVAGLPTRRGSRLTEPGPAEADAPTVMSLRAAGAVIIAKTTSSEFGWKAQGDCPLHGITRNPWSPRQTPGGASAGAGVAAAAGFGALHLGADAFGSVRIPAAWCGVVGLKPSFGLVPQWPSGALGHIACPGPLTRGVRDAALMLATLARFDLRDPWCLPDAPRDWLGAIEDGAAGLRIAVLRQPGAEAPVDWEGIAAVEQAAQFLTEAGAEVEEADPGLPDTAAVFTTLWGAALARLVAAIPETRRHMLDPALCEVAAAHAGLTADALLAAEEARLAAQHAMARVHQRYDLVLCPAVPQPPPSAEAAAPDPAIAIWPGYAAWTALFSLTRQPAIAVPMGFAPSGLPRAVQLAAGLYRDDLVLRAARVLELAQPVLLPEL